jgi:hypothetical protein
MTVPIVTVEEVRALLPIRDGNTTFDTKINLLIATASGQVENTMQRELDRRQRVEHFRTPDTHRSFYDFHSTTNTSGFRDNPRRTRYSLMAFNIDPASVQVHYSAIRQFDDTALVDPRFYTVDARNGYLIMHYGMHDTLDGLQVTYTGGFEAAGDPPTLSAAIPADIKMACLSQVLHLFNRSTADNAGKDSDSTQGRTGGGRFSVKGGMVPEAVALISRYKAIGVGLY